MRKKYSVRLTEGQRTRLEEMLRKGKAAAYQIKHANVLLKVDENGPCWSDEDAAKAFGCYVGSVHNIRRRFCERGFEGAIRRKKQERPSRAPVFDGEKEAHLIALACSQPPEGRTRWTLKLLADKIVELDVVESVSDQTVRRALKKTRYNLTGGSSGAYLPRRTGSSWRGWRTSSTCIVAPMTRNSQ
jgi:transposase